jgi:hypothetical protein
MRRPSGSIHGIESIIGTGRGSLRGMSQRRHRELGLSVAPTRSPVINCPVEPRPVRRHAPTRTTPADRKLSRRSSTSSGARKGCSWVVVGSVSDRAADTCRMRGERGGFTGIFEIVAADKARVGRVKRRPLCAGTSIAAPITPSPPLLPNHPSHPLPDPGGNWGRERYSTIGPAN